MSEQDLSKYIPSYGDSSGAFCRNSQPAASPVSVSLPLCLTLSLSLSLSLCLSGCGQNAALAVWKETAPGCHGNLKVTEWGAT